MSDHVAVLFIPLSAANQATLAQLDTEMHLMVIRKACLTRAVIAQTVDPESVKFHAMEIKDGVIVLTPPEVVGVVGDSSVAGAPAE